MSYINAIRRPLSGRTLTKKHHESTSWTDMPPWRACIFAVTLTRVQSDPNQSPQTVRKVLARLKYPVPLCKARSGFSILTEECLTFRTTSLGEGTYHRPFGLYKRCFALAKLELFYLWTFWSFRTAFLYISFLHFSCLKPIVCHSMLVDVDSCID